jgi:hypothetical protein
VPAEDRAVWNRIAASRGHVAGPFRVLMHSPEVAGRTLNAIDVTREPGTEPLPV